MRETVLKRQTTEDEVQGIFKPNFLSTDRKSRKETSIPASRQSPGEEFGAEKTAMTLEIVE